MTHRKTVFSTAVALAAAALLAGAPALRAETTLASYIEKESRAIQAGSAKMQRQLKMKNWAQAAQGLDEVRARLDALSSRLASIDPAGLDDKQQARLALVSEKTRLMSHFVGRKADLLEADATANRRAIRAKVENLGHRARLLAKAARGADLPLPGEHASEG